MGNRERGRSIALSVGCAGIAGYQSSVTIECLEGAGYGYRVLFPEIA